MAKKPPKATKDNVPKKPGWIKQIRQTYTMTKQVDPKIGLILLGWFLIGGLAGFAIVYLLLKSLYFAIAIGVSTGLLAAMTIFGRRAQSAAYASIEGQPGAAAAALGMLRGSWRTDAAIAFTKQQDIIHRLVGKPGIFLIGEGNPNRLRPLMNSERRKHERVAAETPIHEVFVGDGDGQLPLPKLLRHVQKTKKALKPAQMTIVLNRLKALEATQSNMPIPKGPVPTSMKGARKAMRGR